MLRTSLRAAASKLPVRGLAPKKGKKGKENPAGEVQPTGSLSATEVTGCNIFKNGTDPPILPDDQYPDWLWDLAVPDVRLKELERKGPGNLDTAELKRYIKLQRRDRISGRNASSEKS